MAHLLSPPCAAHRYNTNTDNEVRKSGDALRGVFQGLWSKANIDEDWAKYEALLSSDVSGSGAQQRSALAMAAAAYPASERACTA